MGGDDWLNPLLDLILAKQDMLAQEVPLEARLSARGRKGRLIIRGNPSTVRYFRWTGYNLAEEKDASECRNTIEMTVDLFLSVVQGLIKPREAVAAGLIQVTGDLPASTGKAIYDREEFLQLLDRLFASVLLRMRESPEVQRIRSKMR